MENLNEINEQQEEFNFYDENNAVSTKTPSLKAINYPAGLWVAYENMQSCKWSKSCTTCKATCTQHFKNVKFYGIDLGKYGKTTPEGEPLIIDGGMILNPRLLVIGRSPLLKQSKATSLIVGEWVKGDNRDLYNCVRRFLIICLDEQHKPLHEVPLQLTGKGYFQMSFDQSLLNFRTLMVAAYNAEANKNFTNMNDAWHSMTIFQPTFSSELKGPSKDKQSRACIVSDFKKPTSSTWTSLSIKDQKELTQTIFKLHKHNEHWWKKSLKHEPVADVEFEDSASD